MKVEVKIPSVGESITSGVLSIWHKKDGEQVAADELLFTLETDKVSQEVNAPAAGVVSTKVAEGTEVKIGQLVADVCALPRHLCVQETILWPMVQEVSPL